jgi:arginyl-tRNA synthetase
VKAGRSTENGMDFVGGIAELVVPAVGMAAGEISGLIEIPQERKMGDFALPCFRLAKNLRKAPAAIAQELAAKLDKPEWIERIEAVNGYLNFFIGRGVWASTILSDIKEKGEAFGSSDEGNGKTVVIDYSSINIAKPFAIHHLTTTALGHSLYRIYQNLGYKCVGVNHLGDWGTQFGKQIVAYKLWGDRGTVQRGGIRELVKLYVKFHEEAEKDPGLDVQARAWFRKIEDGDEEALSLFNWFKELTITEVQKVYDRLGIRFDSYNGEAFYSDKMEPVVEELRAKGLLKESDGALIVDLEAYKMPPCLIKKSDGATLYATRDLAAALWRKQEYDFYKCLYVVAYQQNLHFAQLFKVLEMMGREWARDMVHVNFGMVSMEEGSMSTREGRIVWLEDVLNAAREKAVAIIEEKSPELTGKEDVARQVGIGAVLFGVLSNNRIKDIVFSWENALNFDGETSPYIQYTHARCGSVLRKAQTQPAGNLDWLALENDDAQAVIKELAQFPDAVADAAARYEPMCISRQIIEIAKAYNKYYYDHRILEGAEEEIRAKLLLTDAVRIVIKKGLYLLGIEAPERM